MIHGGLCVEAVGRTDEGGQDLYRAVFETSAAGMAVVLPDTRIVHANARLCEMLGYTEAELLGVTLEDISHPDDLPTSRELRSELLSGARPLIGLEKRYVRKNGSVIWARVESSVIQASGGQAQRVLATLTDITERKEVESRLTYISKAVESAGDAIGISDAEGHHVYQNQAFSDLFGYATAEEMEAAGGGLAATKDPAVGAQQFDAIQRGGSWVGELEMVKKDGTVFPAFERANAIRDETDRVSGLIGFINDITERKAAEDELRESESRFRQLAESLPQLVWTCVAEGQCDYLSKKWVDYTGVPEGQQLGFGWLEQLHPDDREHAVAMWEKAVAEGTDFLVQFRIRRHDGEYRWFDTRAARLRDAAGNTVRWFGSNTDVTESRSTEQALRETTAYLENLFGYANAPIIVWDPDLKITRFNHAFEELTGRNAQEVIGERLEVLFPADQVGQSLELVTSASAGERWEVVEIPILRADGAVRTVLWNSATVFAEDGVTPTATIAQGQDITERKRVEEALKEREKRLTAFYDNVNEVIFYLDVEGEGQYRFQSVNPAFLKATGLTRGQVVGRLVSEIIPEPSLSLVLVNYRKAIQNRESVRWEELTPYPAGNKVGDVTATPVFNERGACTNLIVTVYDITERKWAEDEIRLLNADLEQRVLDRTAQMDAANKELEAFSYSVSHDLRAPLRHISGFSNLLMERADDGMDEKSRHYVETIAKSVSDMGLLIDDLLKFSRSGRADLQMADVDMDKAVLEALEPLRQETADRDIEWSIGPLPHVVGDHALFRQVWSNLLGNAAKFSRGRSPARIDVGTLDGKHNQGTLSEDVFYVRDNGAGFDMAYADKLFGVFQRLHSAAEYEGTGIGLANVQRIVRRHGGRVWAEAQLDKGATFFFAIPRRMETPS
jgi:PAS domain S-box-containing protein